MGCIYCGHDGKCILWEEDEHQGQDYENSEYGFDKEGYCCCEDDPDPGYTCGSYENDMPEDESTWDFDEDEWEDDE